MHIPGIMNPSDVLTKFLGYTKFWPLIRPLLFWSGETVNALQNNVPLTVEIASILDDTPAGLRGVSSIPCTTGKATVNPTDLITTPI
jgi:hypothetical protein